MAVGKTVDGNPLKDDAKLRHILEQLDQIDTQRDFRRWKVSFLERFEHFLHANAVEQAEHTYQAFTISLGRTSRLVKKLYTYIQKGDLIPPCPETGEGGRITVMVRKCLNDLQFQLEEVIEHLTGMLPATQSEENELGYSKYHLGAVLIRDGFVEYDRLVICDEILQHMRMESLQTVADRVLLDQMEYYHDRLQMFCDVMADLGLYDAMVKCRQLLYLEEDEDEEEDDDGSASFNDDAGYVPPLALPEITKEPQPPRIEPTIPTPRAKHEHETSSKPTPPAPPAIPITKSTPTPPKIETPPPAKATTTLPKKKKTAPAPAGGLYGRRNNDDSDSDDDSRNHDNKSASSGSEVTEVTENSLFYHQPVMEQKKGENSKAYYNLNTYYHGNPADFLIARKLRNQKENKGTDDNDEKKKKDADPIKSPIKREVKPVIVPKKDSKADAKHEGKSSDKLKHKESEDKLKESKKDKHKHNHKESKKDKHKKVQPLPQSYPPPPPNRSDLPSKRSDGKEHHHKHKKDAVVPPSICIPADDEVDSDEERKSSFLPTTIGGHSRRKKSRNAVDDDVEDLGMESAHGTALMSMPHVPGMSRGTSFDSNASGGDGSTSSSRRPRRRRKNGVDGDDSSEGPPGWDAVLGPTDRTGRPAMHRGMSIMSLSPQDNDDDDSVLPENSLLAPKKSSLAPQQEFSDEEEDEEDKAFIPLTPSQIKAQQKQPQSKKTSPSASSKTPAENEEDSNQTSPTVSSTMEDDNPDKSPDSKVRPGKSSKADSKNPFVKKADKHRGLKTASRSSDAPPMEINIPDESDEKAALRPSHKHSSNPAHHKHGSSRVRGEPMDSNAEPPNAEGLRDFSKPARTSSGLRDYSRKKDSDDGPPSRTKSGLKDYSKRGDRSVNVSNAHISSENGMTKDKHSFVDPSVNGDLVRKPKKELKISMNTKNLELNVPPTVKEVHHKSEKKEKKEKKKEKKANKEKREVPLTEEEKVLMRKKCYMWYARMGQPDRENMKRRVAALPPHCNIYVEDVDLLPWICYGTVLSVKSMNELFMGDDVE